MTGATSESGLHVDARRTLGVQIRLLVKVSGAGLGLLTVLLVLGLILDSAGDQSGLSAVQGLAGVVGLVLFLCLIAVIAILSQAVLLLLRTEESANREPIQIAESADADRVSARETD
ncbi:MAG: hypothetical protein VB858_18165 [Planctomycetaceae bacterium]